MEPSVLAETVRRFNGFAAKGVDEDFGRGEGAYVRMNSGDPTYKLNPSLGALEQPSFYAVQLWPADVGSQGGPGTLSIDSGRPGLWKMAARILLAFSKRSQAFDE
jgi:hypothetical protein